MADFKPTENAEQACKANTIDVATSKKKCAGVDASQFDACVYDYCLTGSDQIVTDSKDAAAVTKAELDESNEPSATVGCKSCALVACGYCHEGCPVSSCTNMGYPDKSNAKTRNGCKPQHGGEVWPDVNKVAVNGGFKKNFKPGITNYKHVATKCRTK